MTHIPDTTTVFVYMDGIPQPSGSGASLRFYSNVRAWIDLGFDVEVVHVAAGPEESEPGPGLGPFRYTRVHAQPAKPSLAGHLAYRFGVHTESAYRIQYPGRAAVRDAVLARQKQYPNALHQFEGDSTANVVPFLRGIRAIYSEHDISSQVIAATHQIERELRRERHGKHAWRDRESRFVRSMERQIVKDSALVLSISTHDRDVMRSEWGYGNVEYLPTSIADEDRYSVKRSWVPGDVLRLLHTGSVNHLPTYRSLEFLLEKVLPRMSAQTLARIRLNVVGRMKHDNERCRRIAALAAPFHETVRFVGFVPDIRPEYEANDVQIVAATQASGLRTRIVESFAVGFPVLCTRVAATGLTGLHPGKNILVADEPEAFIQAIEEALANPPALGGIARAARATYEEQYSREVVARTLADVLARYFGIHAEPRMSLNRV